MPGTPKRDGPAFVAVAAADLFTPAAGTYAVVTHIHFCNQDASPRTVSVWLGATGASADGTEVFEDKVIALNDVYDWYGRLPMTTTDFLVGQASIASMVTALIEYESYVTP